jgi:ABC-type glycerol-3-phosphate transport system permease component
MAGLAAKAAPHEAAAGRTRRQAPRWRAGTVLLHVGLIAGLVVTATPFVYMIADSFKTNTDMMNNVLRLMPAHPTLENYQRLFDGSLEVPYPRQYLNSVIVACCTVVLTLAVASSTGYGFAKFTFRFKQPLFLLVLAVLMIPGQITLVPSFLLMHMIGWLDDLKALIIPTSINAFGVFFMRQTMLSVPSELLDAARIDGASEFALYWRIALPLVRAGVSVLGILTLVYSWNDFLWPVVVLQTDTNMTLPVGLAGLSGRGNPHDTLFGATMAGAFVSTLPLIVIFLALRKQFLSGLTAGAFKGS